MDDRGSQHWEHAARQFSPQHLRAAKAILWVGLTPLALLAIGGVWGLTGGDYHPSALGWQTIGWSAAAGIVVGGAIGFALCQLCLSNPSMRAQARAAFVNTFMLLTPILMALCFGLGVPTWYTSMFGSPMSQTGTITSWERQKGCVRPEIDHVSDAPCLSLSHELSFPPGSKATVSFETSMFGSELTGVSFRRSAADDR